MLNSKTNSRKVKSRLVSGKKQKTLSEKLKSYSLFATALIASGAAANAQVIYTDVDPDITSSGISTYGLDLNNDGIVDYTLTSDAHENSGIACSTSGSCWVFSTRFQSLMASPAQGNSIANGDYPANAGYLIDSNLMWNDNSHHRLGYFHSHVAGGQYGIDSSGSYWCWGPAKFLPLRFTLNDEQHYGWVRLSAASEFQSYTIHDYAYEATPGKSIVAGDTGTAFNCQIVTGLSAVNLKATYARLEWDAVAGAEAYRLRYKVSGTTEWTNIYLLGTHKKIVGLSPNTEYKWQVRDYCQANPNVASDWSSAQTFTTKSLRLSDEVSEDVSFQIYPNPAEDHATIQFILAQSSHVYIKVYDVSGKEIATLLNDDLKPGEHSLLLNTFNFPKGVYLVKLISNFRTENKKLIVQ